MKSKMKSEGSAIVNGKLFNDVKFVDEPKNAMEVVYDEIKYDKDNNLWLYFYHRHLVATVKGKVK